MARGACFGKAVVHGAAFAELIAIKVVGFRAQTFIDRGIADSCWDIRAVVGLVAIINVGVLVPVTGGSKVFPTFSDLL